MLQASSRAASSVHVPSAAGRELRSTPREGARAARPAASAPRRASVRSTVADDAVAVDPLERLGDGHDRDRRPVTARSPRSPLDQRGRDTRARPIVDQHDARPAGSGAIRVQAPRTRPRPSPGAAAPPATTSPAPTAPSHGALEGRGDARRWSRRRSVATPGAAASAASVQASSGRPRDRGERACRRRPSGSTRRPPRRWRRRPAGIPGAALNRAAAGRRSSGRPRSGGRA